MCDKNDAGRNPEPQQKLNRRLKLWELKPHFHCVILGTCLSMTELRKVIRQCGLRFSGVPSDYALHSTMVNQADEKGRSSRALHKFLDRKYKRWIQTLSRVSDSRELEHYWAEAMESGDIGGVFWSLMTHPETSPELISRAYADVHMLSHLQGASNRADLKRLVALEAELIELRDASTCNRQNHAEQLRQRDDQIRRQAQELQAITAKHKQQLNEAQALSISDEEHKQNQMLARRVEWAEEKLAEREIINTELREELTGLKELLTETREEHQAMEQTISLLLENKNNQQAGVQRQIDLHGKQVLYVGGRSRLAPHLRTLVEAHNGQFNHHDGGLEDSRAGLQYTLAAADMVFCPIDCISHDACLKVKKHCQQQAKQFIPLRSSGLSAFANSLRNLTVDDQLH